MLDRLTVGRLSSNANYYFYYRASYLVTQVLLKLAHQSASRIRRMGEANDITLSCRLVLITRCYPRRRYGTGGCNLAEARIENERREGRRAMRKKRAAKERPGGEIKAK